MDITKKQLSKMIDHTILKANSSEADINRICNEALKYEFASVCINPTHVKLASSILSKSNIDVCTVVGFPLGATCSKTKAFEAEMAISHGATEIDMVINIGMLKDRRLKSLAKDIKKVKSVCKGSALLKVIIETCYLTDEEKVIACEIAMANSADFVKTSTGFGPSGATAHDIALMKETVGKKLGVKASGGIRTLDQAVLMIDNGATRLGLSASVSIIKEYEERNR